MAWIATVAEQDARGVLEEEYQAAIQRAGRVFQILKVQSLRPLAVRGFLDVYRAVMHGDCALSMAEREMIAVVVSQANDCHYSMHAHGQELRGLAGGGTLVDEVLRSGRAAAVTPRMRAILDYADKLTRMPGAMRREDLDPLREQGLGDAEILDVVEITAFFNFVNRIANALHVDPEPGMPPYPEQVR
jgi:uncharacterized peroxidase-related enzyme